MKNIINKSDNISTKDEKLKLINSMEIVEDSSSGDEIEYVTVEDNKTNREILHKIGLTDEEIEENCYPSDDGLDITNIAFQYAKWYSSKDGFSVDEPKEEKRDYTFCDDDCIYCDENGYCPFNEVHNG